MTRKDALHRSKHGQQVGAVNFILEAMRRGENPRDAQNRLESRDNIGIESEQIALEAFRESPEVRYAETAQEFDDRTRKYDIVVGLNGDFEGVKLKVQVKSSVGGQKKWMDEKSRQYALTGDLLERKLMENNLLVVVAGNEHDSLEKRKQSVQSQLNDWLGRKRNLR